ncbi:HAD family phosphatase [Sphingobacterium sp. N143]|uniref:HAD family hydrolase n=1 Tax=Sphingobacterium sp. N143 TaxID=2746727 RepID=UPI002576876F|nr:HAD family phosphatase [Sphingobacterium sp. N143]MDM1296164.1 HAD family phosphatase [Sphingobacterium sp. N143]
MEKIKNIVLDYGNVIFMIDFVKLKAAFTQLGIENVDEVFGHHGQSALFDDFDKGKIDAAQFRAGIRGLTKNPALTDEQIDAAWNSLLVGVPKGSHEILLQLKAKYRTFLLSNNNAIHYAYCMNDIREKYGVADNEGFFEKTYYSHLVGMRKPDAEIFTLVMDEQQLNPSETLFIDDSPQHLATASQLGWHTALCTKEKPLSVLLEQFELL